MKKALSILISICIMLLSACEGSSNKWKPTTASEDLKPYAEQAIKVIEQYLNFDIDAKTADEKISTLLQRMDRLEIDAEESKYNKADKVIARVIEMLKLVSIKHKSDIALRQDIDILSVQLGKKPSGRIYDPSDFTHSDNEEGVDTFIDIRSTSAVNYLFTELDNSYSLHLYFDAMYGTKAQEVSACIEEILDNADKNRTPFILVSVDYTYYNQSVFTVMLTDSNTHDVTGSIFNDSLDDILEEFENEEQLNTALRKAISFAG